MVAWLTNGNFMQLPKHVRRTTEVRVYYDPAKALHVSASEALERKTLYGRPPHLRDTVPWQHGDFLGFETTAVASDFTKVPQRTGCLNSMSDFRKTRWHVVGAGVCSRAICRFRFRRNSSLEYSTDVPSLHSYS